MGARASPSQLVFKGFEVLPKPFSSQGAVGKDCKHNAIAAMSQPPAALKNTPKIMREKQEPGVVKSSVTCQGNRKTWPIEREGSKCSEEKRQGAERGSQSVVPDPS